jgi:hypothetical protein
MGARIVKKKDEERGHKFNKTGEKTEKNAGNKKKEHPEPYRMPFCSKSAYKLIIF